MAHNHTSSSGSHTFIIIIIILKKLKGGRVYLGSQSEVQSTKVGQGGRSPEQLVTWLLSVDKDEPGSSA